MLVNKIHLIEPLNRRKQRSSHTKPGNGRWKKTRLLHIGETVLVIYVRSKTTPQDPESKSHLTPAALSIFDCAVEF
jgi:hypothetical protein